jgi:thiol-disulfide isomerase/thioredoxin
VAANPENAASHSRPRRLALIAGAIIAGALAGLAGVYGIGGFMRNADDPDCRPAVALAQRLGPLARGEVAAMAIAESPLRVPDLAFRDQSGAERRLSDWRGRTVLLNLWATWCIPCRKEMPALDALEGNLGGERFEVVAVNIDTRDSVKPRTWLEGVGVSRLAYYADQSAKVFQDLKLIGRAFGLPTTVLIDPAGCEIGTAAGPAEWASQDGVNFVRAAIGG